MDALIAFAVGAIIAAIGMAWWDRRVKGPKKGSDKPAGGSSEDSNKPVKTE